MEEALIKRIQLFLPPPQKCDLCALFRQSQCVLPAQTGTGTGDNCHIASQIKHCNILLLSRMK